MADEDDYDPFAPAKAQKAAARSTGPITGGIDREPDVGATSNSLSAIEDVNSRKDGQNLGGSARRRGSFQEQSRSEPDRSAGHVYESHHRSFREMPVTERRRFSEHEPLTEVHQDRGGGDDARARRSFVETGEIKSGPAREREKGRHAQHGKVVERNGQLPHRPEGSREVAGSGAEPENGIDKPKVVLQGAAKSSLAGGLVQYEDEEPDDELEDIAMEEGTVGNVAREEKAAQGVPRQESSPKKQRGEGRGAREESPPRRERDVDRRRVEHGRSRGYGREDDRRSRRRSPEGEHHGDWKRPRHESGYMDRGKHIDRRSSPPRERRSPARRFSPKRSKPVDSAAAGSGASPPAKQRVSGFSAPPPEVAAPPGGAADGPVDISAAVLAAKKAANMVNTNMVYTNAALLHKKKLIWGGKKTTEQEPSGGLNRWDAAQFQSTEEKERFNKFMGLKGEGATSPPAAKEAGAPGIMSVERQRELQQDLEKQYTQGLRRKDGRTVGLGL